MTAEEQDQQRIRDQQLAKAWLNQGLGLLEKYIGKVDIEKMP